MKHWLCFLVAAIGLVTGALASDATKDREALDAQAKRFWGAEVQQDWNAVYDLLTPGGREGATREEYAAYRKEQGPLHFVAAQIGEVTVAGDIGWVRVTYQFKFAKYPEVAVGQGDMWDLWRNTDAWRPVPKEQRDQWPKRPPQERPAADEAALAARTDALWQAKAAQDWKTVYQYLPPAFRAQISLEEFLSRPPRNLYVSPRIEWTEVDGESGRVKVAFAAKPTDPAVSKMEPQNNSTIESWIKRDGQWYLDISASPPVRDRPPGNAAK
jgi:hypothetical protein